MNKPFYVNVVAAGHGDREAAANLEMYDFSMTERGPQFYRHDLDKFIECVYRRIDTDLSNGLSLAPNMVYDGATLWIPPFMSQHDAFQVLDRVCDRIHLMTIMAECRTSPILSEARELVAA